MERGRTEEAYCPGRFSNACIVGTTTVDRGAHPVRNEFVVYFRYFLNKYNNKTCDHLSILSQPKAVAGEYREMQNSTT